MQQIVKILLLGIVCCSSIWSCNAAISGPYLFWGQTQLPNLQPSALIEAKEPQLSQLFRSVKTILIFVRNTTSRLDSNKYPRFQNFVKANDWAYLPQRNLAAEPFNYNENVKVITLSGANDDDDAQLVTDFNDAVTIYGTGAVLGILANREEDAHYLSKREAKEGKEAKEPKEPKEPKETKETEEDAERTTTPQTPTTDETEKSFVFVADGKKAVLYLNSAPVLRLGNETYKLVEHRKSITFDDQKAKGYGRLNIIFVQDNEKLFLRFNFTLDRGSWYMRAVEVEFKDIKSVLTAFGTSYTIPSAPLGFSYRCSANELLFTSKNDSLVLTDYQVQPWLNGRNKFGDIYDCVGFTTAPILAGVLVSFFLAGILAIGVMAMLDMHTPNRFENSRSKQLQLTTQD